MPLPNCPNPAHAGSRVVRAGRYGKPGHQRQRFKCHPTNGDPPHRFTPLLTRQGAPASHCSECSSVLAPWDGQAGARAYRYDARAISRALAQVADGVSYRQVSIAARYRSRRSSGEHGQLVANWVDVFGPLVTWPDEEPAWPDVLILDSRSFRVGIGPGAVSWHVLAAAGRNPIDLAARPWTMLPSPYLNQHAWNRFLQHLQGKPRVVVADMDRAIHRAVSDLWPGTGFYYCEFHMHQRLRAGLHMLAPAHPIRERLEPKAFESITDWENFTRAVDRERAAGTAMPQMHRFLRLYGADIEDQIRRRRANDPRSTGAVEAMLGRLDTAFPRRRANRLANLYRTTHLLRLISAAQRGVVDEVEWAVRIRKFVESHNGHMPLKQRPHDDQRGHPSLHY